jgi:hypothetical protein
METLWSIVDGIWQIVQIPLGFVSAIFCIFFYDHLRHRKERKENDPWKHFPD